MQYYPTDFPRSSRAKSDPFGSQIWLASQQLSDADLKDVTPTSGYPGTTRIVPSTSNPRTLYSLGHWWAGFATRFRSWCRYHCNFFSKRSVALAPGFSVLECGWYIRVSPYLFHQLYTIHASCRITTPMVFALLPANNRTTANDFSTSWKTCNGT